MISAITIVPQGFEYTVERFGQYVRTLRPGLYFIWPIVLRVGRKQNMKEQVIDIPQQQVISKDNATAAAIVALVLLIVPDFPWYGQFGLFAVLTIVSSWLGTKIWPRIHPDATEVPQRNRRGDQLIGGLVTVAETFQNGQGRVRIGDSLWRARSRTGEDFDRGVQVRIVDVQDTVIIVAAVRPAR